MRVSVYKCVAEVVLVSTQMSEGVGVALAFARPYEIHSVIRA